MDLDTRWYLDINGWTRQTPALHAFLAGYALWGGLAILAAMLIASWWWARGQGERAPRAVATAVLTGAAAIAALLINQQLISTWLARPRPCQELPHAAVLLACSADYSMPSDHAVVAGAFVAGLWLLRRDVGALATAAALLLAFSRVYAGVHYPSDTLVGLLVGFVIALVVVLAARPRASGLVSRLADTRYAALVRTRPR
jgi:membrane-associated phospholipid phosphatase